MTAKQIVIRSALTASLPFVLLWAFSAELWRGIRSAFRFAWLEARANVEAYHDLMQRDDF